MTALHCSKRSPTVYKPRRPEKTVLFEVVKKHYKTWLKKNEKPVPFYIDKEFKQYLQCGILAHGFACAHCKDCQQNFLLAFSCKGRGICPSCNAHTMAETAANGVFETENGLFKFHEAFLTPDDCADAQDSIRKRVLKLFARRGWIEKDEIEKMLTYENSGFSLDAKVRIEAWDREGLERLIRYCSRPCFASENLRWNGPWLIYRLPKPTHTGQTFV